MNQIHPIYRNGEKKILRLLYAMKKADSVNEKENMNPNLRKRTNVEEMAKKYYEKNGFFVVYSKSNGDNLSLREIAQKPNNDFTRFDKAFNLNISKNKIFFDSLSYSARRLLSKDGG